MTGSRVVITGLGVVAPGGIGVDRFWSLISSGGTATRRITSFDPSPFRSQVAAECDFDPAEHGMDPAAVRDTDRATQLALAALREAVDRSGVDTAASDPFRRGVCVGTAVGATTSLDTRYGQVSDGGRKWLVDPIPDLPALHDYAVPGSIARDLAWATDSMGPVSVVSTGCTSGLDAVAHACETVREGRADMMIAGAADAPISPITLACFDAIRATTARNDRPAEASRPFDRDRDGFVLGEGAAMFVLEELGHARRRGATVLAEIAGHASRCNAFHMTGLRPDGREMAEAIRVAMAEARIAPEDVRYVNAHGSGTRQNDRHETAAFKQSLGEHAFRTPVSSIKSMIGHSLGAIGSIEIAACVLAIGSGVIPPTANLTEPDPECDLDYVPLTAREVPVDVALTVGSGFGGFQSAMVLTAPERGLP